MTEGNETQQGIGEAVPPQIPEGDVVASVTPYRVGSPAFTFQTIEKNPESGQKFILFHKFRRLDASNIKLYLKREKDAVNETEDKGKGVSVRKTDFTVADENFYDALIIGGGVLPYGLSDEEARNTEPEPLTVEQMKSLEIETKQRAIRRLFKCKFEVTSVAKGAEGFGFLFAKDGVMTGKLYIPDKEEPAYTIPMEFRRPAKSARTELRTGLYIVEDLRKGDLPRRKTKGQPEFGTRFFDQHFNSCENVAVETGSVEKDQFLSLFSPIYKVEIAASIVASFDNDEQD